MERSVEWQVDPTLERIAAVMDLLGSPQRSYPVIHIAGTNGKTTTARMIDTLLAERNLRVGRFTSPHLASMRERISVDGVPLTQDRFVEVYRDIEPYLMMVDKQVGRVSFFEALTAMAYAAFADAPVDVAVVETGMGGSWDATNVADATVAVITPIALDHTEHLGPDLRSIAVEKAGIIKDGATAVLAQQELAAAEVLIRRAAEVGAVVAREGLEFGVLGREVAVGGQMVRLKGLKDTYDEVFLPMYGAHQASNAACALAAVEVLTGRDPLDADLVRQAFARTESPGRLEVVRRGPTVIVDVAHNPAGMRVMVEGLRESFDFAGLIGVVAAMKDKDVRGMLELLEPVLTEVVVTRNSSPRSMDAEDLATLATEVFGEERVRVTPGMDDAINEAIRLADEAGEFSGTGVLITGSVVTVGDARLLLRADGQA